MCSRICRGPSFFRNSPFRSHLPLYISLAPSLPLSLSFSLAFLLRFLQRTICRRMLLCRISQTVSPNARFSSAACSMAAIEAFTFGRIHTRGRHSQCVSVKTTITFLPHMFFFIPHSGIGNIPAWEISHLMLAAHKNMHSVLVNE